MRLAYLFSIVLFLSCQGNKVDDSTGPNNIGSSMEKLDSLPENEMWNYFFSAKAKNTAPVASSRTLASINNHLTNSGISTTVPKYRFSNVQMHKIYSEITRLHSGSQTDDFLQQGFDGNDFQLYGTRIIPIIYDAQLANDALQSAKLQQNQCYLDMLNTMPGANTTAKDINFINRYIKGQQSVVIKITYDGNIIQDNLVDRHNNTIRTIWNLSTLCPPHCPGYPNISDPSDAVSSCR